MSKAFTIYFKKLFLLSFKTPLHFMLFCAFITAFFFFATPKIWAYKIEQKIPNDIKITEIITTDFSLALPSGHCAGVAFKLSDKTSATIKQYGLKFFKRMSLKNTKQYTWKSISSQNKNKPKVHQYRCLSNFQKYIEQHKGIVTNKSLGYYTSETEAKFIVYPDARILLYFEYRT